MAASEKAWLSCTEEISVTYEVSQLVSLVLGCRCELNLKLFFFFLIFSSLPLSPMDVKR